MTENRLFASDNCSSVHPQVLQAIVRANEMGQVLSYGDDSCTIESRQLFRQIFGGESAIYYVYNGTAANVVAINSLLKSVQSVLAPSSAHIGEDEGGSLEAISGSKIEFLPAEAGKIRAEDIGLGLGHRGSVHRVQPGMVSITQSTELGQVYSIEELTAIGDVCREEGLIFHMDGARISNAVATELASVEPNWMNLSDSALISRSREILAAMTLDAGVQALSLGGTKNGLMFGEGIVLMNGLGSNTELRFFQKQNAQLASKMRYISAQFTAMYEGSMWVRNALNANHIASIVARGIDERRVKCASDISLLYPVQANAIFVRLPDYLAGALQKRFHFYDWTEGSYRIMTSWDSREEDAQLFLSELDVLIGQLSV